MSSSAALLIADARRAAGLTQTQLGRLIGLSQPVVSRLERPGSNPTWDTVCRALDACGVELAARPRTAPQSIDETIAYENLKHTVDRRVDTFQRSYANARAFALQARRSLGGAA